MFSDNLKGLIFCWGSLAHQTGEIIYIKCETTELRKNSPISNPNLVKQVEIYIQNKELDVKLP